MPSADTLNMGANMAKLFSLEHIAPPTKGVCPRMIGDPKNLTTGRVWCRGNLLALLMPVRQDLMKEAKLADVRDFVAQASRV